MTSDPRRHFVLGPCLGRGGYGEVYRATTVSSGGLTSQVAVKLVRAEIDVASDAVLRLRDEARLLARLAHPNIVRVIDLCRVTDDAGAPRIALVTELVDGRDLDHLRRGPEPIGLRASVEVLARVARGLQGAWSGSEDAPGLHVVHRDVKPGNIAVGRHGDVKLLDFGIARFEGEDREARTATAMLVGSLPYLAPERFLEREVVPASDAFALGCVLFECATGQRWYEPIAARAIPALASDRDRYEAWRWERLTSSHLPEQIRAILANLLAWNAGDRSAAEDIAERLEGLDLEGPPLRAWCRSHRWDDELPPPGPLTGAVLYEESGEVRRPAAPAGGSGPRPIAIPLRNRQPIQTIDPGHDERPPRQNTPLVATAQSVRPARPQQALNEGTIFAPAIAPRAPQQRLALPVRSRPPSTRRGVAPALLAVGCGGVIFLVAAGIAAVGSSVLGAIAWYG